MFGFPASFLLPIILFIGKMVVGPFLAATMLVFCLVMLLVAVTVVVADTVSMVCIFLAVLLVVFTSFLTDMLLVGC